MYRIRFHGRGGQGIKTASRILGTALFLAGFEVQDAPRYGAERRGAPIFAYVRADRRPILERGVVDEPDLVLVADDSLLPLPAAGIMQGLDGHTVLLLDSVRDAAAWRAELNLPGTVRRVPRPEGDAPREAGSAGVMLVGAAARALGTITPERLDEAVAAELGAHGETAVERAQALARHGYAALAADEGAVTPAVPRTVAEHPRPNWINLMRDRAPLAAPSILGGGTSVLNKTGLWRTVRPVIDRERCKRCTWVCGTYCPDNAVAVDAEGYPVIDYDHCKGCLICLEGCPAHAIEAVLEEQAAAGQTAP